MRIGPVTVDGMTALAPMAGVADRAMRLICRRFGAPYVVGEMASCKGFCYGDRKSAALLAVTDAERPMAAQIFGSDPALMAACARGAMRFSPDVIDINMGCPAPKITGGGAGSALMKNPELAGAIIDAVARAVPVPVTVKMRLGWDDRQLNAPVLARIAEQSGAAALTVHGRTRAQQYAGVCDLGGIRAVVEAVSIPVTGNGDVTDAASARRMLDETGCARVMIGRGALGAPWIFGQIEAALAGREVPPDPEWAERMEILKEQAALMIADKGERGAMLEARRHAAWYMKGLRGAAALRREAGALSSYADLRALCAHALETAREAAQEDAPKGAM